MARTKINNAQLSISSDLVPASANGAALGSASYEWSDLFLADSSVIKFGADQDITLTHVADLALTLGGAGASTSLRINNTATDGDVQISFQLSGTTQFSMGVEDGDSDKFVIERGSAGLGTSPAFEITSAGVVAIPGTTANTSATDGALTVAGGLGVALDVSIGDDLRLLSDSAVLSFGADSDTTLTHTDGTGLTLNSTNKLCFNDATQFIYGSSGTILELGATDEIGLTATTVDMDANLDLDGTANISGLVTVQTGLVPDAQDGAYLGTTSLQWSDLFLADAAVIGMGDDNEVTLTHVPDAGILLNGAMQLQFGDSGTYIKQGADAQLDMISDGNIVMTPGAGSATYFIRSGETISATAAAHIYAGGSGAMNIRAPGTATFTVDVGGAITMDMSGSSDQAFQWAMAGTPKQYLYLEKDSTGQNYFKQFSNIDLAFLNSSAGEIMRIDDSARSLLIDAGSKIEFRDTGLVISSSTNGQLDVDADVELECTAPTVNLVASTAVTMDTPSVVIASATSTAPILHITNTNADANPGELRFNKDSASGADSDVMGMISFYGTDDSDNTHERLAYMDAIITDSAHGSEASSLRFYVAENDATLTQGLLIAGQADDNGEVDVTIGAGAGSTCTISGDLTVTGTTTTVNQTQINVQNAFIFEGASDDGNETTLTVVDPQGDNTIYLPDAGGYLPLLADATTNDGAVTQAEFALLDGGTARGTDAVADGDGILTNDGGTMRQTSVQTFQTYFDANSVGGTSIVTAGALNAGSITSGFGAIDNGTSGIRTATFTAETAVVPDASGGADLGTTSLEWGDIFVADDKAIQFGSDQDAKIEYDEDGTDQLRIHQPAAGVVIAGANPKLVIGDAGAEDTLLVFDGNAVDYRVGLDDGTDKLEIGAGAAHGTTAGIKMSSTGAVEVPISLTLASGATCTAILDEDGMGTNSATALATQQSIKAYVDATVVAADLDVTTDSGTIDVADNETLTITGGEGIDTSATGTTVTIACEDATASNKGVASFGNGLQVSSGAVTIDSIKDTYLSSSITTGTVATLTGTPLESAACLVFLNGMLQTISGSAGSTFDYTLSGTTLTLTSAMDSDDVLIAQYIKQ